jgi:hypothetical protein
VHVRYQGHAFPDATPFVIGRHSHPRARPETTTTPPAPATGINYLELVAADHHRATAAGINFHALTDSAPSHEHPDKDRGQGRGQDRDDTAEPSSPLGLGQMPLPGMPAIPESGTPDPDGEVAS